MPAEAILTGRISTRGLAGPEKFAAAAEYLMERKIPEKAVKKMFFTNSLEFCRRNF